jgi:hypothetical protein
MRRPFHSSRFDHRSCNIITFLNCLEILYECIPTAVKNIKVLKPRPVLAGRKFEIWSESWLHMTFSDFPTLLFGLHGM